MAGDAILRYFVVTVYAKYLYLAGKGFVINVHFISRTLYLRCNVGPCPLLSMSFILYDPFKVSVLLFAFVDQRKTASSEPVAWI